jgi:hypothetical protein
MLKKWRWGEEGERLGGREREMLHEVPSTTITRSPLSWRT